MLPLKGITVVSVEQAVAAPFATRQLADLGARVIKIERPDGGDFAQNLAPGAAGRLGAAPSALRARHPRLIVCSVSGYGSSGPYAGKKAYDLLVQSEVGLVSITGREEAPAKVGISVADIAAGMYAYSGILTALLARTT